MVLGSNVGLGRTNHTRFIFFFWGRVTRLSDERIRYMVGKDGVWGVRPVQ